jgi:PAS domain-containing protein
VIDPDGTLVYFNKPAEGVLGASFEATGELTNEEWSARWQLADIERPGDDVDLTLAEAFRRGEPGHAPMYITGLDGARRVIEVTCIPIIGFDAEVMGGMIIFWPAAA